MSTDRQDRFAQRLHEDALMDDCAFEAYEAERAAERQRQPASWERPRGINEDLRFQRRENEKAFAKMCVAAFFIGVCILLITAAIWTAFGTQWDDEPGHGGKGHGGIAPRSRVGEPATVARLVARRRS